MKTIGDILTLSTQYLEARQITNARREAEDLLSDALSLKRIQLYMNYDRPLTEAELTVCRERLGRRGKGEPSAYIHGEVEFFGCTIAVSPAVLIPRQETELLVDKIVTALKGENLEGTLLWDLCCGSGCIGIALKKAFPALTVELSDIRPEAVAIAKANAMKNGVDVTVHQGDLFAPFAGRRCRYFVCNPPYVSEEDYQQLAREVRDHEPHQALVAGDGGFAIYARLATELPLYLEKGGKAWMEIGTGMGNHLLGMFSPTEWKRSVVERDYAGHDRFFFLENE